MPETTIELASALAEKCLPLVSNTGLAVNDFVTLNISLSIGVTCFTCGSILKKSAPESLISRVDQAMYEARQKGRNSIETYHIGV